MTPALLTFADNLSAALRVLTPQNHVHATPLSKSMAELDAFEYIQMDEDVVRSAMVEPDPLLRSLDAIHLATARLLGPELTALLTYDDRLAKAAEEAGIPVHTHAPREHSALSSASGRRARLLRT